MDLMALNPFGIYFICHVYIMHILASPILPECEMGMLYGYISPLVSYRVRCIVHKTMTDRPTNLAVL